MLIVIYINLVPELALTAGQLLPNVIERQGGDRYQPGRSVRAEGNDGPGRIARWQPQRSYNWHSKRAPFLTQSRVLWIRDRHVFQRSGLRQVRLAAGYASVGSRNTRRSIDDRIRTNSSSLPSASMVTSSSSSPAPSGRSAQCGLIACPRLEISPCARSENWLARIWRSGETDNAIQPSAKYRHGRLPRDPPSFGRAPKQFEHCHANRSKHAIGPTLPIWARSGRRTLADGPFRPVAIASLARLRSELEHVRNPTNLGLKQTQSNGAQRPFGSIA